MTKTEFIREFAEVSGLTLKKSKEYVEAIQGIVYEHINDDDGIKFIDGLTLTRSYWEGRSGRNPQTGEKMTVGGRYIPRAKFGRVLKEAIKQ